MTETGLPKKRLFGAFARQRSEMTGGAGRRLSGGRSCFAIISVIHTPSEPSVLHPTAFAACVHLDELEKWSKTWDGADNATESFRGYT